MDNRTTTKVSYPLDAWATLSQHIQPTRKNRLEQAAAKRTNHIRLILQDIHSEHNVSACLRSAEAFGVLNVDIVNLREKFKPSTVAKGCNQWLRTKVHTDIQKTAEQLKASGYRLIGGYPDQNASKLSEVDLSRPVAVIFGNEHDGLNKDWRPYIDEAFTIPMDGLVESLNISVSCAISLYDLTSRAKKILGSEKYHLSTIQQQELLCEWICMQTKGYSTRLEKLRTSSERSAIN